VCSRASSEQHIERSNKINFRKKVGEEGKKAEAGRWAPAQGKGHIRPDYLDENKQHAARGGARGAALMPHIIPYHAHRAWWWCVCVYGIYACVHVRDRKYIIHNTIHNTINTYNT
jgi:hypothetical protein